MNVYVAWTVDHLDGLIASALMSDNIEELRRISYEIRRGSDAVHAWASAVAGSHILTLGLVGAVEVPADRMTELPAIAQKFEAICQGTLSVGVGMSLSEAYGAMRFSQLHGGNQISLYHSDMEEALSQPPEENALTSLGKAGEPDLQAELTGAGPTQSPSEQRGLSGKFEAKPSEMHDAGPNPAAPVQQPSGPDGPDGPPGGDPNGGFFADGGGEGAPQQEGGQAQEQADPRTLVVQALQRIKQQAPILEKIKETNPAAFEAVKSVVEAMIAMAQGMAAGGDQAPEGQETQKSELEKNTIPAQGDPSFDGGWNVFHEAGHGTYRTTGALRQGRNVVEVQYTPKKSLIPGRAGKPASLGFFPDKHQAAAARLHHHDQVSAGIIKEEMSMEKGALPMPKAPPKPHHDFPVGTIKDGKVKVEPKDPQTGASEGEKWRSARSGQVLGEDGAAHPARKPNS